MAWKPDYITSAQYKAYARIGDTTDDTEISTAITAASRAIDRSCGRQFGQVASVEQRTYEAEWDRHRSRAAWIVTIDDLDTTTGLIVSYTDNSGVTTTITDYTLEPRNAVKEGKVYTRLVFGTNAETYPTHRFPDVDMTALWGWSAFPTTVIQATKLQTHRFIKRRDSPYGIAGSPADGSEIRLLARVDPDVELMLGDYRRRWGAA